jgi:putative transposase/transposase-like zinc-binding protein
MMRCRTEAMGGHVESCPNGHVHRIWYNSCKHRVCPQCAALGREQWLNRQKARFLDCDHYHVIFTVPQELNDVWAGNKKGFADLLFRSVRDTLLMLLGDPKYLGATPGLLMAMHTWGRNLIEHPHIHCLVTGGGLADGGKWKAVVKKCLLPRKVLMMIFRGKLLDALRHAASRGELALPGGMRPNQFLGLLNKLGRAVWNVKIMERYSSGMGVLTYLACYLRGGPISNRRLLAFAEGMVTFRYQDHRDLDPAGCPRSKELQLSAKEFLRRLLTHIPVPGLQMVRSYALYANTKSKDLTLARQQLGQKKVAKSEPTRWQDLLKRLGKGDADRCPVCGAKLIRSRVLPRSQGPPPCKLEPAG